MLRRSTSPGILSRPSSWPNDKATAGCGWSIRRRSWRRLVARSREHGIELCLRLCVICRPTREEAIAAARAMLPDEETEKQERRILSSSESQTLKQALAVADEVGWMNQNLWAGLVPFYGSSSITLGRIA